VAPIDIALAVASREIGDAIATARSAQSAGSGNRVPGVARGTTPPTKAEGGDGDGDRGGAGGPAGGSAATDQPTADGAAEGGQLCDSNGAGGAEEALPDLGLAGAPYSGRPSRRRRAPQVAPAALSPPREDEGGSAAPSGAWAERSR
jgi:hypothetical protein